MSYNHLYELPLDDLIPLVTTFSFTPDLWIMRMSTMEPMQIEKRLVYECINSSGGEHIMNSFLDL